MSTEIATESIRVLLIEDNPGDARLVCERLLVSPRARFEVETVGLLASAIERLRGASIDVVLLDLSLPDSQGIETIALLHAQALEIPIVALSGMDDEDIIQDAVKQGAEDYLIKGAFTTDILVRTILYAIDRRHLREDLAHARDSALESARLRSEFLANMSHEIRTPLNGVVGMTRLLVDTLVSPDQREMLEIASTSADTLLRIVNDILDFSKISAGKVVLEDADFDLGATIENLVQIFSEQAHVKGLVLDSFVDTNVPIRVRGDSGRLRQVLINLIGNAVKFTSAGEVTIRVERISGGADYSILRFQVHDTGIGIPLDGQRNIFQAFTQADGSTTRRFGGTGLGLTISAQLVELMGGSISVESELDYGSTFWFTTRLAHQPFAVLREGSADNFRLERVRVLIVDGNPASARVIADHLRAWRMRAETVASLAEAAAMLKQTWVAEDPFQIAIIDLEVPDTDVEELARAIKDQPDLAGVRVLGLYALGARPQQTMTRAAGIRALLSKPVRQSDLFETLNTLMSVSADFSLEQPHRGRPIREIKSAISAEIRQRSRILLVEDNLVNQQVEMRMLSRIGYHAESADNGRLALEKLQHANFDLILMDCQMPEVDGYMVTREIRRQEGSAHHIPIIGVTAHALPGDREACLRAGMDDYIAKPVMPEDLAAMIDEWIKVVNLQPTSATAGRDLQAARHTASDESTVVLDETVLAELHGYQNPGEPDFITELIGIFNDDLINRLAQMHAALEADDANRVRHAAHALKGASAELGLQRMRAISLRLEQSAAEGSVTILRPLVQELEDEAVCVRAALAPHCIVTPVRDDASVR